MDKPVIWTWDEENIGERALTTKRQLRKTIRDLSASFVAERNDKLRLKREHAEAVADMDATIQGDMEIYHDLGRRIQWAINQHRDITEAGRCKRCNVASPCRTVRILTGTEELAL